MLCWVRVGELTMSIFKGSRYEYSTVDYVATNSTLVEQPIVLYTASDLGLTSYNNPQYWWLIVEYNPEINDFINVTPGTILRVPNV